MSEPKNAAPGSARRVEPTKVCSNPECPKAGQRQPWSAFYPKVKWPDGTMRQPHSRCKRCHGRTAAQGRAQRRYEKARWDRIKNDPAALESDRERQRLAYRDRRERQGKRPRANRPHDEPTPLPVEPLRDWLLTLGPDSGSIAKRLGMPPKTIYSLINDHSRKTVKLDTVDRICLAMGVSIDAVYPPEGAAPEGTADT